MPAGRMARQKPAGAGQGANRDNAGAAGPRRRHRPAKRAVRASRTARLAGLSGPFCSAVTPIRQHAVCQAVAPTGPHGNKLRQNQSPATCPSHYNTGRPATLRRWHGGPCTSICRRSCYSGMLPCFFGGLLWFLLRHISRAHISLRRVSRGMMTSSMSPRSAVRYGLENSSS